MNHYHLGLPAWAFPGWNNRYFTHKPSALASYATVFNTVEGNTTFYQIPDNNTVARCLDSVSDKPFKLCFKLPRTITHQQSPNYRDLHLFMKQLEPLHNHLGPFLVQFPATAGPQHIRTIQQTIDRLPGQYRYTLEVRHPGFFRTPEPLQALIQQYQLGLAVMDTRPIFKGNHQHPEVLAALHDKPDVPVWDRVFNNLLFVRLLLHPDLISNKIYIEQWSKRISKALDHGCECYMMIHCPNNLHCPPLALEFHDKLRSSRDDLDTLPSWPVPQQHTLI